MSIDARFGLERGDFYLDADFSVPGRGISALFGPSGSGKTTLLRAIAGLERIPGGALMVGDEFWQRKRRFRAPERRSIGYVFQEPSLFHHLDVRGNLDYGRKRARTGPETITLDQIVDWTGIARLLDRRPDTLSGGERQRVAIARALAVNPRLLLMDEPVASLDQAGREEILSCLDTLHRELEIPVIYVSHNADEISRLADYLVLIRDGRVLGQGPIRDMLTRLDLPLAHDPGAATVIETRVGRLDGHWQLTVLTFDGGRFLVPATDLSPEAEVRVRVESKDVSIALREPEETSILNIIPAIVEAVADEDQSQVTVRLLANSTPILARITRKSAQTLRLAPGSRVFAQVKSVALLR